MVYIYSIHVIIYLIQYYKINRVYYSHIHINFNISIITKC